MRKSSKCECGLLLILSLVIFTTLKTATAIDAPSQPPRVPTDAHAAEEIPTGFKLERYARLWEHNPFTLVAPTTPQAQRSAFDKLILTSWLKDGRKDVIFIQNLENNEVQKITAEPNQNNLRLIALHLDPSPQFVEAVISDGKEQGLVKFRFDLQSSAGQTAPPMAQITNTVAPGRTSDPARPLSGTLPQPQVNSSSAQTSTVPTDRPLTRRLGSGTSGAQMVGGSRRAARGSESEGVRLLPPQTSG